MRLVNAYLGVLPLSLCRVGMQGAGWSVTIMQSLFFKNENILCQHW